ncbi:MAG: hypothetical protein JWP41_1491, partial [Ramlibacter sp.]|nr:hypothetical protein [Ramlibacter sp.]
ALAGGFSRQELARLMINAFDGAWLPAERKARYIAEVWAYAEAAGVLDQPA